MKGSRLGQAWCIELSAGLKCVLHQERNSHRADAAGDGGDGAAFGGDFVESDVADEFVAFFGAGGFDAVDADINDDSAFLDVLGFEELRAADGGDDDVGLTGDDTEVAGAAMGDGDGGIAARSFGHEKEGHGFAYDHAAADHDGVSTRRFDACVNEQALAAEGGAGDEAGGVFEGEFGDVDGVKAVNVFGGVDGAHDFRFVDMLGRWALHENAVDGGVGVELFDQGDQFCLCRGGGEFVFDAVQAEVFALFIFGTDVSAGSGVVTDEDDGESRRDAPGFEISDFSTAFGEDFFGDGGSGDEGGHGWGSGQYSVFQ